MTTRHSHILRLFTVLVMACSANASASVKAAGSLEVVTPCEAYRSFAKGTDPGFVRLSPAQTHEVEELNANDWDWIRLEVPGANEPLRWVPGIAA